MDLRTCIVILVVAGVWALILTRRRDRARPGAERLRRGVGHAMLGLQQFVEPSVEHIFQAENAEQAEDEDADPAGDGPEVIFADLAESLGRDPIDAEEVRRHLAAGARAGLDWRDLFDRAVRDALAARPYRAPSIPPVWKVAPRE
jgi:hypothetical protein